MDFSAHQLLERARSLGFRVLAITLHDAVFDRKEVFADAAAMGILLISAAEVRLLGADVIVLNVTAEEMARLKNFDDLRRLRARRGNSIFTIAPHPFYIFGGSIGSRLISEIDCFDAIEFCHFHIGLLNPNRWAKRVAARFGKPLIATSDAHRLHAFGRHYTSMPMPSALTVENVFARIAQRPVAPNKSRFERDRFCERDLFRFSRASVSSMAKDRWCVRCFCFRTGAQRPQCDGDSCVRS